MRIKPIRTIVTGAITRELLAQIEPAKGDTPTMVSVPHAFREGWSISLRRCSVNRAFYSYLTGGAELVATMPSPSYGGPALRYVTHLSPGWTAADVDRAVCRAHGWFRVTAALTVLREGVYAEAEGRDCDGIEAEETSYGKFSDYSQMTTEDCRHWMTWLKWQPAAA